MAAEPNTVASAGLVEFSSFSSVTKCLYYSGVGALAQDQLDQEGTVALQLLQNLTILFSSFDGGRSGWI